MTTLIVMAVIIIAFLFIQSSSARKRQARQQQMRDQLTPGTWIMTTAGFYGQFVERDGEVVILQTVDGTETFWSQRAIAQVVDEPPFAPTETVAADDDLAADAQVVDVDDNEDDKADSGNEGNGPAPDTDHKY